MGRKPGYGVRQGPYVSDIPPPPRSQQTPPSQPPHATNVQSVISTARNNQLASREYYALLDALDAVERRHLVQADRERNKWAYNYERWRDHADRADAEAEKERENHAATQQYLVDAEDRAERAERERDALRADNRLLRQKLERFGVHDDWCSAWPGRGGGCECGFSAALSADAGASDCGAPHDICGTWCDLPEGHDGECRCACDGDTDADAEPEHEQWSDLRVDVIPFTDTKNVVWDEGKPRCAKHHGHVLVHASAVGLSGGGHLCSRCMREALEMSSCAGKTRRI